MPSVEVMPGKVRLVLDVRLPPGYKRNPDMPASVILGDEGQPEALLFAADEEIAWQMDLGENRNLTVALTLYYCKSADGNGSSEADAQAGLLCLIHDQKMVLPLRMVAGGPGEARISVRVQNGGFA